MEVKSTRAAQAPQPSQPVRNTQVGYQTRSTGARNDSPPPAPTEQIRPVVNTQGQQTGRLLNVSA